MKIAGVRMTAAAAITAMLLGGCGAAPYELTESEENIIVNYSAHVLAKYNANQKDGLTLVEVPESGTEETVPDEGLSHEEDVQAEDTQAAEDGGASAGTAESDVKAATLNELFGMQGLELSYAGAELSASYMQDSYYAQYPERGKVYLIVRVDIANTGDADAELNNIASAPLFKALVNGEIKATAEITPLLEDFAAFEDKIPAGTTKGTVLLFQVPDTVTQIDSLELSVTVNGDSFQIIL